MEAYLQMYGSQPLLFALIAGAAVAMLAWGVIAAGNTWFNPIRRRLASLRESELTSQVSTEHTGKGLASWWARFEPKAEEARRRSRMHLAQAGLRGRGIGGLLLVLRFVLAIVLPLLVLTFMPALTQGKLPTALIVVFAAFAGFVGFMLPEGFVQRRIEWRREALMEGFPDALDLLVACTEAGLSFNAALERVVEQMPASQPELAWELSQVNAEIRAGIDRTTALRNLADRTGLDEIRGLVSLITHSTRLGTGIAGTLRIYAEEFRDRRMQRAEEVAATIGTRLIFPLVLCLFPAFFVIAVGPAVVGVMRALAANPLPG